ERLRRSPQRGCNLHDAARGTVVFGTERNPGFLRLGLEILQWVSADPDLSQRSARLRRIHPGGRGSAVEGTLHPPAGARPGQGGQVDLVREAWRPGVVQRLWASADPA